MKIQSIAGISESVSLSSVCENGVIRAVNNEVVIHKNPVIFKYNDACQSPSFA